MTNRYHSITPSLYAQRKQSYRLSTNKHFNSGNKIDWFDNYGFATHEKNIRIKTQTVLSPNDKIYRQTNLYTSRQRHSPFSNQKYNPFLHAKAIRYSSKQTKNTQMGITSWQKYKYLNKFKQNKQDSVNTAQLQGRKMQQRQHIIRSIGHNNEQKQEIDFTVVNTNALTQSVSFNPQIQDNSSPNQKQLLQYSITRRMNVPQFVKKQQRQKDRIQQSPSQKQSSILNQQKANTVQTQIASKININLQQKAYNVPVSRIFSFNNQLQIEKHSKQTHNPLLLFSKSKQNPRQYPSNIIYKNTAYQLIPFG